MRDPDDVHQKSSITNENENISVVKDSQESQDGNNVSQTDSIKDSQSEKDDDSNAASTSDKDKSEITVDDQEINKYKQNSSTVNGSDANLVDKT